MLVDSREKGCKVVEYLKGLNVEFEVKQLAVGDYQIGDNCIIERKSAGDFIGSLMNSRLNNQLQQMSFNFDNPMLVIEGIVDEVLYYRKIKRDAYISSLSSSLSKVSSDGKQGKISLVMLTSPWDVAHFLKHLENLHTNNDTIRFLKIPGRRAVTDEERILYLISSLPNVGITKAVKLLNHFSSISNLVNSKPMEIKEISGFGDKIANSIHNLLHKETNEKTIKKVSQKFD